MKKNVVLSLMIFFFVLIFISYGKANKTSLKFEIFYPSDVHPEKTTGNEFITGRAYVIISRNNERELRFQTGYAGVPIWGENIFSLKPGEAAVIDEESFGYPLRSIKEIPPGEYFVQGFINLYSEFKRSDGHTIWAHNDQWEGQQWNRSPGNIYSDVIKVSIDPAKTKAIKLNCNHVIPPVEIPSDSEWVKRIKFESKILTDFWGRPMYLGATILLPKDYDKHSDVYYPVNYVQGHFSLAAPHGFRTDDPGEKNRRGRRGYEFYKFWNSDKCPRMIAVTFQHPCPYYDDSYAVNSQNVGPYGDAIMNELIPYIEEHFRVIRKPYARMLSGGSTGGWESFALQIFHPDFFGGTWTLCPDSVGFNWYEPVNIYEEKNAYYKEYEWIKVERPGRRDIDGQVLTSRKDLFYYELALGDKNRSCENFGAFEAVYSPIAEDGYPKPLWNWLTGEIDHSVAEYWKENYDLFYHLEKNWSLIGPELVGKLHIYVGDMDTWYLNNSVVTLEKFLESTKDPYYAGVVKYGWRGTHCWGPRGAELIKLFEEHITKNAPRGENPSKWKY